MKVLFPVNLKGTWPYIQELADNLACNNVYVDILDYDDFKIINVNSSSVKIESSLIRKLQFLQRLPLVRIFYNIIKNWYRQKLFIPRIMGDSNVHYDIIHLHYTSSWYRKVIHIYEKHSNKILLSVWGSDFYIDRDRYHKMIYDAVDLILLPRTKILNDFVLFYNNYKSKIVTSNFGRGKIDLMKKVRKGLNIGEMKKRFNIPSESFIITCGHNAREHMQHRKMINALKSVEKKFPKNTFLLFPMTYRKNKDYILSVKKQLDHTIFQYKIIEEFLSDYDIINIRLITDVYINFVTTDALNSSFLEHLYANNIVICGSWLNYNLLKDNGIIYFEANEEILPEMVLNIINNYKKIKLSIKNNEFNIYYLFSWNYCIKNFIEIYEKALLMKNDIFSGKIY